MAKESKRDREYRETVERAREYDRERRRSDARENGSGGLRTRSEDQ